MKNRLMSPTLLSFFMIFAFKFESNGIKWFWEGKETVPLILIITTLILSVLWLVDYTKLNSK